MPIFEVDPTSQAANIGKANIPLKFLGRFEHEAAVVEEATGRIYLTEDADEPNGLFYRWTPPAGYRQGKGALHALAADGAVEVGALEALPPDGFQVVCFPVKVHRGSAGWTRAVAILPV